MNYIRSLQMAIDYMEENILTPINYEDVARHVYMSNYHFHRIFSMLTGITANEYIRNRRLSMAGQELILSNIKIIDLAYKYQYETPESFTKAFCRFHGATPTAARQSFVELKSFNRLTIKIKLEGGKVMNYKITKKESFKLLAKVKAFSNEIINDNTNTNISDLWTECNKSGVIDTLSCHNPNSDFYGVCAQISKESKYFDYGIGVKYCGGNIPDGFKIWEVNPTLWAVFECIGDNPDCISKTWDRIFKEFLPGSEYEMLDDTDLELYPQNGAENLFCEIWIPVKKKLK